MMRSVVIGMCLTAAAWCQAAPVKDAGSGAATIGKSVAGGAYDVAKGTAAAVVNLGTGHPVGAATSLGTGLGKGGLHAATGTAKGLGKIGRGAGGGLKRLVHL